MRRQRIESLARSLVRPPETELYFRIPGDPRGKLRSLADPEQFVSRRTVGKLREIEPDPATMPERRFAELAALFGVLIPFERIGDGRKIVEPAVDLYTTFGDGNA